MTKPVRLRLSCKTAKAIGLDLNAEFGTALIVAAILFCTNIILDGIEK